MIDRRGAIGLGALLLAGMHVPAWGQKAAAPSRRVRDLVRAMSLPEKFGQMTQIPGGRQRALNSRLDAAMLDRVRRGEVGSFLHVAGSEPLRNLQKVAVEESRLKVPLLFAMDVIHGYRTIVPVQIALASSWEPRAMENAARLAAEEAWAAGLHWTFAPMIDVARDARWGRVVEGAGEDPYLASRMAEAQVRGFQTPDLKSGQRLMACAKHFAGYGAAAGGRDYDSADISERTLQEVYMPPFFAAMRAGAGSFMTGFHDVGGVPMTAHADMIRGQLRGEWGYQGLVVSDWNSVKELINHGIAATPAEAAALALRASVDMDMASSTYAEHLAEAVKADRTLLPLVDEAVTRILVAKESLGLFDKPYDFGDAARETAPVRRSDAQRLALNSIVLLRNEGGVLPLRPEARIALIGALADDASSCLGSWRARGQASEAVTLRKALSDVVFVPGVTTRSDDVSGIPAAVEAAKGADVVVLAIGEDFDFSGEARSYADIGLPGPQEALIEALKATGKPIVAVLMNGRPLALGGVLDGIPAVLETWYLGIESGPAIVEVLMGRYNPGGKLPIGFPAMTGQSPLPYAHMPAGRPANEDLAVDSARYHDAPIKPLFPFGHGLSYTKFDYGPLELSAREVRPGGSVTASVTVTNSGQLQGEEVVQLYARDPVASVARPVKELRGFQRIALGAGQSARVSFTLTPDQFAIWHGGKWLIEPGEIRLMAGSSSEDIRASASVHIIGRGLGTVPAAAIAAKTEIG
jgi:beta-glucosidase